MAFLTTAMAIKDIADKTGVTDKIFKSIGMGGPRVNTYQNNLTSGDPQVWHNGNPYDGSQSKSVNMPLYMAQKAEVQRTNPALHDAFEKFKMAKGNDPTRSEWEQFAKPALRTGSTESVPAVPNDVTPSGTGTRAVTDKVQKVKDMVVSNPMVAIPVIIGVAAVASPIIFGKSLVSALKGLFGSSSSNTRKKKK